MALGTFGGGGGLGLRGEGKELPSVLVRSILQNLNHHQAGHRDRSGGPEQSWSSSQGRGRKCKCCRSEAFARQPRLIGAGAAARGCRVWLPESRRASEECAARTGLLPPPPVIDARGHLRLTPLPQHQAEQPAQPTEGTAHRAAAHPATPCASTRGHRFQERQRQNGIAARYFTSPGRPQAKPQ